jgi:hypothetical protein
MGYIILIIVVTCLTILFNKLDLDEIAFGSGFTGLLLAVLFFAISLKINEDRKFIKERYDDLNIMLTNKVISSKGISDALEVNDRIEYWKYLKDDWFLGSHYSEEFGKPLLKLPDFYSVDSLKVINK